MYGSSFVRSPVKNDYRFSKLCLTARGFDPFHYSVGGKQEMMLIGCCYCLAAEYNSALSLRAFSTPIHSYAELLQKLLYAEN